MVIPHQVFTKSTLIIGGFSKGVVFVRNVLPRDRGER